MKSESEESSTESETSGGESDDDSEPELLPPIVIRRTRKGRKVRYEVIERGSDDEEEGSGSGSGSGSDAESATESEQEEGGEDEADNSTHLRLKRAAIHTLRFKRLPDAAPADTKTRHAAAANLSRYQCQCAAQLNQALCATRDESVLTHSAFFGVLFQM